MKVKNKALLITYPDSLGSNLQDLTFVINKYFKNAIGGVHLLPFFPSAGDRGFSPLRYDKVDPKFGTWKDVEDHFIKFPYFRENIQDSKATYHPGGHIIS